MCAGVIWKNLFRMQVSTKAAPGAAAWSCLVFAVLLTGVFVTHSHAVNPCTHAPINTMCKCGRTCKAMQYTRARTEVQHCYSVWIKFQEPSCRIIKSSGTQSTFLLLSFLCKSWETKQKKLFLMSPEFFICQLLQRPRVKDRAWNPFGRESRRKPLEELHWRARPSSH